MTTHTWWSQRGPDQRSCLPRDGRAGTRAEAEAALTVHGRGPTRPRAGRRRRTLPGGSGASRHSRLSTRRRSTPAMEAGLPVGAHTEAKQTRPPEPVTACVPTDPGRGATLIHQCSQGPQTTGDEALTFLLKLTNPATFHLELRQIRGLGGTRRQERGGAGDGGGDAGDRGGGVRDGGGGLRGAAGGRTSAWASRTCSRCPARWPRGCWAGSSLQGTEGRHGRGRDITGVGGTQEDMPLSSTQAGPGQTGWCWGLEARPPWLLFLWATPRDTSPREHLNPSFLAAPLQDTREPWPRPPGPSSACLHRSRREHTPAWSGAAVPEPPRWGPDGGSGPRTTWSPASSLTGPASLTQPSSALPCSQLAPQGLWDVSQQQESSQRLGGAQHGRERPPWGWCPPWSRPGHAGRASVKREHVRQ